MANSREDLIRELQAESRQSTLDGLFIFQAVAERSGLNLTDLQCIGIIASTGPVTAGQLAETMGLTTGAVTGLLNRMERAGYVQRERDPGDGRRVVVRPVMEELARVGAGFFATEDQAVADLVQEYDDRDLALFLDFMRKANVATREEIVRVRSASTQGGTGEFAAPLGNVKQAKVVFANGASRLTLQAGPRMPDLYQARFQGAAPKVDVKDAIVTFRHPKRFGGLFDRRDQSGRILLNPAVSWAIEVRGGAYEIEADLTGVGLTAFRCTMGFSDITLALPVPSGEVPVRLSGGASKADIRRPAGVEARLRVTGGLNALTFDERSLDPAAGKVRLQSPGYDEASDRYDIEIAGGASEITMRQANEPVARLQG